MIQPPSLNPLTPSSYRLPNGNAIDVFPSQVTELVRLDISFEAGAIRQECFHQAAIASKMIGEATMSKTAHQVAEFLDFRGIAFERSCATHSASIAIYMLRKYAEDMLSLLNEMITSPSFTAEAFNHHVAKRRQQMQSQSLRTSYVARNLFYEALYGRNHPLGSYAEPEDIDTLTLPVVERFIRQHYQLEKAAITLSGCVDDDLLSLCAKYLSTPQPATVAHYEAHYPPLPTSTQGLISRAMPNAVQSTLRIGRVLPFPWNHPDYCDFMVLSVVLGGYFGSRLMSNIREEKGYTYGIYSQTRIDRSHITFFITADVGIEVTRPALDEVMYEIGRLREERIPEEELNLVRNFMMGEFIRSIDGVFEIAERYVNLQDAEVNPLFTSRLLHSIQHVSAERLQQLAIQYLQPDDLLTVVVGEGDIQ